MAPRSVERLVYISGYISLLWMEKMAPWDQWYCSDIRRKKWQPGSVLLQWWYIPLLWEESDKVRRSGQIWEASAAPSGECDGGDDDADDSDGGGDDDADGGGDRDADGGGD